MSEAPPTVAFETHPSRYKHWKLEVEGEIARLRLDVDERGGLVPGYELKMNSYDLGVDIELHDAVQRLRFEHPQVKAVVVTSAVERNFCAGANIRMLAQASHGWKVNFCKFTNETRLELEDASEHSGQSYLAALNGTAAGGGYEIALACERILLIDDQSSAVSLPEVPLLGVLPGTGGLTRLTDKRRVRRDLADVFSTRAEGVRGKQAVAWRLVDEAVPKRAWDETVAERAAEAAARSTRLPATQGIVLTPLERSEGESELRYRHVHARLAREAGLIEITIHGPAEDAPESFGAVHEQGAAFWPLAMLRELDDLILHLRTNEPELGIWVLRTRGELERVLAHGKLVADHVETDWLANEIQHFAKRAWKRLDVTSRSLLALIEPGSCFAGSLFDLALACDRQYMLDGTLEDAPGSPPAEIVLTEASFGALPMANGLTRLEARFHGEPETIEKLRQRTGERLDAAAAAELGLVTDAPDEIDWQDEIRILLEERTSLSPDALTAMEANLRFVGPETMESRIFSRLSAWQNWVFVRPNASGPEGTLRLYGTGRRAQLDKRRI